MKNLIIIVCLALFIMSCSNVKYEKYSMEFDGSFDTLTIVTSYEKDKGSFDRHFSVIYDEMTRLHMLCDIYNNYEGLNNVKTINDNAGAKAVEVDEDLLEIIEFGKQAYDDTDGVVNIALGAVLKIWHEYREKGMEIPEHALIPTVEELKQASEHTNINDVVIDKDAGTVFLKDPKMSLDLGAIAKGYAVELAVKKARKNGFVSGIISAGGNVYSVGKPADGREAWSVGVQNPFAMFGGEQLFDAVYINDKAVVSSGNYQRFYVADGEIYHHIIDTETLMPAQKYSGVTIIHTDSGIADMLSTAAFIMPYEDGRQLLDRYVAEAIWLFEDGTYEATDGYKKISKLYGVMP